MNADNSVKKRVTGSITRWFRSSECKMNEALKTRGVRHLYKKKKKALLSVKTEIRLIRDTISRKAFLPRAKNDQC